MKTKQFAINVAGDRAVRTGKPMFIYRVGPAWMYTSESEAETQKHYKVKVREFQQVNPDERS